MTLQQATLNAWRLPRGRGLQSSNENNQNNLTTNINNTHNNDNNNNIEDEVTNNNNTNNNSHQISDGYSINDNQSIDITNRIQTLDITLPISRPRTRNISSLRQQTLGPQMTSRRSSTNTESWGNNISRKPEGIFRVGFRNINSLPTQGGNQKNKQLIQDIKLHGIDCMGITENNLAWQNLPFMDQLNERFQGMFEFAKYTSANNKDPQFQDSKQSGGTMNITQGNACARILNTTVDPRKLGRWVSTLFRGQRGLKLRVVTVYRPVLSVGSLSAYQQQRSVLLDNDIDICPREQLLHDLKEFLIKCKEDGEQIITIGDFNDDIRGRVIQPFFQDLDMRELILELHGQEAPNTFEGGVHPIDGIFGTRNIQPVNGGYTAVEWGLHSDHRMIWVDVSTDMVFGTKDTPMWKPMARRLKCNDPRLIDRFNKLRNIHATRHNLAAMISEANIAINEGIGIINMGITEMMENIDSLRTQGILWADRYCRKLKMGNIPWSPAIQQCMDRIKYYTTCRLKFEFGRNINSRTLSQLFHKTTLLHKALNVDDTKTGLKLAFNQYNLLKSRAPQLWVSFLKELAEAKAEKGNGTKETILRQLQLHEEQRSVARKIKYT